MVVKCAKTIVADGAVRQQPPQVHGQRLVVIVLADDDDAAARGRAPRAPPSKSSMRGNAGFSTSTCLPAASASSVSVR